MMKTAKLEIPIEHLMVIEKLLMDAPYRVSAPILHLIKAQVSLQQQVAKPEAAEAEEPDAQAA